MRNEKIQIDRLNNAKAAIAEAITAKGVQVPESTKLDGYPTLISQISTSGSGGGKSIRTCRVVVGTSTAGWTENDCDYLCDGTSDEVEIQAAINALPEDGGEIVLLDGDYNTSGSNVTVQNNQIYNYAYAGIQINSETGTIDTIQILHNRIYPDSGDIAGGFGISFNITAKHVDIIGNYISNSNVGINLNRTELSTISNNYFDDHFISGVRSDVNSKDVKIINNTFTTSSYDPGMQIAGNGFVISQNIVLAQNETATAIKMEPDCINVLVSNNYVYGSPVTAAGKHSMVVDNIYWEPREASGGGADN